MARTPLLFQPISFRGVTARNRIAVSPMCQYSASDGVPNDWHIQHLGARAMGGAGIVFTEASAVSAVARITPNDLGLYNDTQQAAYARLAALITLGGAVPGIQIAHAGRKGSCTRPWEGDRYIPVAEGGWQSEGPTEQGFSETKDPEPHALTPAEIGTVAAQFAGTARRALAAGFKIAEIHAAHGYLLHSFLSPISNTRSDAYGGDVRGRARMLMEVLDAVRAVWPTELPLFVRLSCSDFIPGGLTPDGDILTIARMIAARGDVDLIDCSAGGISPEQKIPSLHPGYQVPFAEIIRREAGIATGAVGLIEQPTHAAEIIANERADIVLLARAVLADPAWPLRAARRLGVEVDLPGPYGRATVHE
ncbi:NADH:flavin oxidoreductase/NADH oxidase [Acidisoma cellulosilytica]|uniref:NADH:flavin oxidoreductase/NADH oxidase n=1 Tax=Acidisoma cellulosilyticum TaxID=2802395 RepID=A0A963YYQ1_9PROT|nr:NADH:flavin oxidoreductase/NADH oxidase [Acidisoma cellulosilyticum]MCB8879311.1 NADH:flavin oxidoreductase/NADH oxidase [Acidisoma cellulosilyticum]